MTLGSEELELKSKFWEPQGPFWVPVKAKSDEENDEVFDMIFVSIQCVNSDVTEVEKSNGIVRLLCCLRCKT